MHRASVLAIGAAAIAAAGLPAAPASASSFVFDNFATPASAFTASLVGPGIIFQGQVPGTQTTVNADTANNPANAVSTLSYGAGALSLTSSPQNASRVEAGYGAFGSSSFHLDATPYNYYKISFNQANVDLNLNAVMFSATPTGPNIYYTGNGTNIGPIHGSNPFDVYIPIGTGTVPGFNYADVNGIVFVIQSFGTGGAAESSWAITNFSLTSGTPEPGTWALMLLGVGAVGGAVRSRRRAAVAAS